MDTRFRWCFALALSSLAATVGCHGDKPPLTRRGPVPPRVESRPRPPQVPLPNEKTQDETGPFEVVVEPPAYSLVYGSREGFFEVEAGSFSGILHRSGREAVPPRYHELWFGVDDEEPWFVVANGREHTSNSSEGGRWGLVNHRGQEIVPPRL